MNRRIYLFLLFIGLIFCGGCGVSSKQESIDPNKLIAKVRLDNYYGYINIKGEKVIKETYVEATHFSEGYACVKNRKKWHFIDTEGNKAFPEITLDYPTVFINGKARIVSTNSLNNSEKFYYLHSDGSISPKVYEYASNYQNGVAEVKYYDPTETIGFIDENEDILIHFDVIDKKDAYVSSFSRGLNHRYSEGMLAVCKFSLGKQPPIGFYDTTNEYVIPPKYYRVGIFKEGLCPVAIKDDIGTITWGYINTTGETVINFKYEQATNFEEGVAAVKGKGKNWDIIDKTGTTLFEHHTAIYYNEGLAPSFAKDSKTVGFVDKKGKFVIQPQFLGASHFVNGFAWVYKNSSYGYINKKGEEIISPHFRKAGYFFDPYATNQNDLEFQNGDTSMFGM